MTSNVWGSKGHELNHLGVLFFFCTPLQKSRLVFSGPSGHAEQGVSTNPPEQDPGVPPGQAAALPQRKTCSIHVGQQTIQRFVGGNLLEQRHF